MTFRPFRDRKGSALIMALLVTLIIAATLLGSMQLLYVRRIGDQVEIAVVDAARVARGYRATMRQDIWNQIITGGDWTTNLPINPNYAPELSTPWAYRSFEWGAPSSGFLDQQATFIADARAPVSSVLWDNDIIHRVRYDGKLNVIGSFAGDSINRTIDIGVDFFETPTFAFELVATDAAWNLADSAKVVVNGSALLVKGSVGSNSSLCSVRDDVYVTSGASSTLAVSNSKSGERISWGTDTSNLLKKGGSLSAMMQSYANNATEILYTGIGSGMPSGMFIFDWNGASYIAIDLASYNGDANVFITTSGPDAASGLIIFGASAGSARERRPVSIATTCNVTLVGSNSRSMILVSDSPVLTVYSHIDYGTGTPATGLAQGTRWAGYLHFPVPSANGFTIMTPQVWSGSTFTIAGTLATKGGGIHLSNGVGVSTLTELRIDRNDFLRADLIEQSIHKDRMILDSGN